MPKDSNDDVNIDELLAELKNETSEESKIPKKEIKDPFKGKTNDDYNDYEFSSNTKDSDEEW